MIRTILLVAASLIFALLALAVITTDPFKWEMAGLALGFAALIPWPR